jgi:hypothetical protein
MNLIEPPCLINKLIGFISQPQQFMNYLKVKTLDQITGISSLMSLFFQECVLYYQ